MKIEKLKSLMREFARPDISGIEFASPSGESVFARIVDDHIRSMNDIPQEAELQQVIVESVLFDFMDERRGSVIISGFASYGIEAEAGRVRDIGDFDFEVEFSWR